MHRGVPVLRSSSQYLLVELPSKGFHGSLTQNSGVFDVGVGSKVRAVKGESQKSVGINSPICEC